MCILRTLALSLLPLLAYSQEPCINCITNTGKSFDSGLKTWCWYDYQWPDPQPDMKTFKHSDETLAITNECNNYQVVNHGEWLKFHLNPSVSPEPWCDDDNPGDTTNFRAEISTRPWSACNPIGTEEWIGFSYKWGDDYIVDIENPWLFWQCYPGQSSTCYPNAVIPNPPLSLIVKDDLPYYNNGVPGEILVHQSSLTDPTQHYSATGVVPTAGQVHDFVIHVIWGDQNSGLLEIWIDGVKVYTKQGATVFPQIPVGGNHKFGIYKWDWRTNAGISSSAAIGITEMTAYMSNLRILTHLPGDPLLDSNVAYSQVDPQQNRFSNLALGKLTSQSSTYGDGESNLAVNGDIEAHSPWQGSSVADLQHTQEEYQPWWEVDLGGTKIIESVFIYNRSSSNQSILGRLNDFYVFVSEEPFGNSSDLSTLLANPSIINYFFEGAAGYSERLELGTSGRYVRIQLDSTGILHMSEVEVKACEYNGSNLALGKPTSQSSTYGDGTSNFAVDSNFVGDDPWNPEADLQHTSQELQPWWEVDLGGAKFIENIIIHNRTSTNESNRNRLHSFYVLVSDQPFGNDDLTILLANPSVDSYYFQDTVDYIANISIETAGQHVRIQLDDIGILHMAEVEVMGWENILSNLALGKPAYQSSTYANGTADFAVDSNFVGDDPWNPGADLQHTSQEFQPWWEVDLGDSKFIDNIVIYNRTSTSQSNRDRLHNFYVLISDQPLGNDDLTVLLANPSVDSYYFQDTVDYIANISIETTGQYVRIQLDDVGFLHMAEVEVMGWDNATSQSQKPFFQNISIKDNEPVQKFAIVPNPNRGEFKIYTGHINSNSGDVNLYDIWGRRVFYRKIQNMRNDYHLIDANQIPTGVYKIVFRSEDGQRFIGTVVRN